MQLTESNLVWWKQQSISRLTMLKNVVIANFAISNPGDTLIDSTGTIMEDLINGVTYTNPVTPDLIKNSLTTLYSYVSLRYMTVFEENNIVVGDLCTDNSVLSITPIFELPTMDGTYFDYTTTQDATTLTDYTLTVTQTPLFDQLLLDITDHPVNEVSAWTNLGTTVQSLINEKVLYQLFRSPKTIPVYRKAKDFLLYDMKLKDLIILKGFQSDFSTILPEVLE